MAYNTFSDIPIDQTDKDSVSVHTVVATDRLTGTVLQNKQIFDAYPDLIVEHFNDLCDYIGGYMPSGDVGLTFTQTEIAQICSALGCTEADITL